MFFLYIEVYILNMISHSVFRNNTQGHQNLLYIGGVVLTKNIKPKIIANDYRGVEMSIF